jgi:hypothetical protein
VAAVGKSLSDQMTPDSAVPDASGQTGLMKAADGYAQLSEEASSGTSRKTLTRRVPKCCMRPKRLVSQEMFSAKVTEAAWRMKPSFYAVSKYDQTINPDLERFLAERMQAKTIELDASHPSVISDPYVVPCDPQCSHRGHVASAPPPSRLRSCRRPR